MENKNVEMNKSKIPNLRGDICFDSCGDYIIDKGVINDNIKAVVDECIKLANDDNE